jgi:hypothetical protein
MKLQQLTLVALLTLAITACKKDDPVTPTPSDPTPTTAAVKVNYTFVNGTSAFDPNVTFDDGQGNAVRITKLKFYSHDMHLTDDDDNTVAEFHDDIVLVDALNATNEFELGTMTPGHVHNVAFELGLDSASSYGYPDQMTAPAPLDDNDMTWSMNPDLRPRHDQSGLRAATPHVWPPPARPSVAAHPHRKDPLRPPVGRRGQGRVQPREGLRRFRTGPRGHAGCHRPNGPACSSAPPAARPWPCPAPCTAIT